MECKHCGADNGSVKKCCGTCGKVLEGNCFNNVSGEDGHGNADGSFIPTDSGLTYQEKDALFEVYSFAGRNQEPVKRTSLGFVIMQDGKIINSTL